MSPAFFAAGLRRELRGSAGRLSFFVACLAVGVAAVVAVAGLSASLEQGIRGEARQLLAADLKVSGRTPPGAELDEILASVPALQDPFFQRADLRELATVVAAPGREPADGGPASPGRSQLVELKVVSGGYPFYGELRLEPDRPLGELLGPRTAVVAPDLLTRLGLAVGDSLRIGRTEVEIAGTVLAEPDRVDFGLTLGPRVFLAPEAFAAAELGGKGSRVEYTVLLKLPEAAAESLDALAARLREELPSRYRVETYREAQPALRDGLRRVDRFLGLVALLSLLVGGIGVGQTVRAWLAGRMDSIAILKCLGLRPREILTLYLGQAALLGLAGSLVGMVAGIAIEIALPLLLPDLVPAEVVRLWQPAALARGLALGVGVAVLFSAPPLVTVWRVPPARVLRRDAEPLRANRWATAAAFATLAAGVYLMAALQSGSAAMGLRFLAGLAGASLVLGLAALLVTRLVARLPRGFARLWLRHGLAGLARPGAATLGAIVALGLGVLVVLAMSLVQSQLAAQLTAQLPENTPSAFLVDIQPDQWSPIETLLEREEGEEIRSVPVVMGRLTAIDGQGADGLARENPRNRSRRWALTREQRLTYLPELPADNRIVAGALWSEPELPEISVEEEFARDLGVGVGSVLRFDIQGVPLDLTVTSLRSVDWGTFGINFFLVVEPGVLDAAPQQRVATVRLPEGREQPVQDLLADGFPNVTYLKVREILEKIAAVLERIGLGVRFLGGFTVLAGIAILGGAVSATSARRGREVALLKTLGMTRRGVVAVFSVEYALIGLVAGMIGAVGGGVLAWVVLTRGMELRWTFELMPFGVAVAASVLLTVAAGLAASVRALSRRPIEVLRGE